MSEENTTAVADAPAAKPAPKKPAAKPAAKKAAPKPAGAAKKTEFHGVHCPSGRFWNAKRVAIVEALRKLRAESDGSAQPADKVAAKTGGKVEKHNVVRYCADEEPLVAGGIVRKAKLEGQPAVCYYLSALGRKCGFDY